MTWKLFIVCAGAKLKKLTCLLRQITTEKWGLFIRGMHYSKHYIKKEQALNGYK